MSRYVTLGADKYGQVYGLEIEEGAGWRRNPLGLSTNCVVIRPVKKENYKYLTEDPESAKELWQVCVAGGRTEQGLAEWFKEYVENDEVLDLSWVYELLDDERNPTVALLGASNANDGTSMFRAVVKTALIECEDCEVDSEDDMYAWEASGFFPPDEPFVVEFATRALVEEYYEHLRQTKEGFGKNESPHNCDN